MKYTLLIIPFLLLTGSLSYSQNEKPAIKTLERIIGYKQVQHFNLTIDKSLQHEYRIRANNNRVFVIASDNTALCRGIYDYLSNTCNSMVSWSGNNIHIPDALPDYAANVKSQFKYHFYLNVVTHGYTMPYWDLNRWEKEIDWMAMHGINMPLVSGAHEAILSRVFKKIGLTKTEIDNYFTGPAHLPWNRMGNVSTWDGPLTENFYKKQVELFHQVLKRMKEMDMHPIVPSFAGFVPRAITRIYPDEKVRELSWGGFDKKYQAHILEPGSKLFISIGKMFIQEWEKEFGKNEFYLADSFNEMDVPLSTDSLTALHELASYGESVYRSIKEANADAVWVMQGWTFPYQKKEDKIFWTPDRLHGLVSNVPDDKLLILDLANEYNKLFWKIDPSWKMYDGFWGKQWIYSFIPNMGGKTSWNGILEEYAKMPYEAFNYTNKKNLIGFGFAPEGIENNEIIYELLSDIGWSNKQIDFDNWLKQYCIKRYNAYPKIMQEAFALFQKSCYGAFTDHPRHKYQFRPTEKYGGTVNNSDDFKKGVELFLQCKEECGNSSLYQADVIELVSQAAGLQIDAWLKDFQQGGENNDTLFDKAISTMYEVDKLLASHPTWRLNKWISYADNFGTNPKEKQQYTSNAKRLITTWGGWVNEYAAKTWSGLIRDYYIPRWQLYVAAKKKNETFDLLAWEENWIRTYQPTKQTVYDNVLEAAGNILFRVSAHH